MALSKRAERNITLGAVGLAILGGVAWYEMRAKVGDTVVVPIAAVAPQLAQFVVPQGVTRLAVSITAVTGDNMTGNVVGLVSDANNQVQAVTALAAVNFQRSQISGRVKNGAAV
jgi:hypothetical protein